MKTYIELSLILFDIYIMNNLLEVCTAYKNVL